MKRLLTKKVILKIVEGYLNAAKFTSWEDRRVTKRAWGMEAKTRAYCDCGSFYAMARPWLDDVDLETIGINFWMSRNHEGVGFFDSGCKHSDHLQKLSGYYPSLHIGKNSHGHLTLE